jgi:hypothetical protein
MARRLHPGSRLARGKPLNNKSFLLLFFKKEALPF